MEIQHCTPKVVKLGSGRYNTARPKNWFRDGLTAQAMKVGYEKYLRFIWPLLVGLFIVASVVLAIAATLAGAGT
jgi:uncharacterized ion transporter superfamily protein YfcC